MTYQKKILPVDMDELKDRPTHYDIPWFTISNSMSETYSSCREAAYFQYVRKISKKLGDSSFLRRNCVVFVIRQKFMSIKEYDIEDTIQYFLRSESKSAIEDLENDWELWLETCQRAGLDPIRDGLLHGWKFPQPEQKWKYHTWNEYLRQLKNASTMLSEYIDTRELTPFSSRETGPIVQKNLTAPLIVNGEILDETEGKPTNMKAQVNLYATDGGLYIWKISSKKSSDNDKVALYSETADNQAAVIAHHLGSIVKFPMPVTIVKAIVKKTGEKVRVEEHKRFIHRHEIDTQLRKLAIKAKDIKSMNLFKERSFRCPMCDYYDLCILGKSDEYKKTIYGVAAEDYQPQDVDDDMPF